MPSRIILALDELSLGECLDLVLKIGNRVDAIKIHNLYDKYGAQIVKQLHTAGATRVWVDAKLHDIPNTVRLRAEAIAESGADIISVHASGGTEMMAAALKSKAEIYAVTLLTSRSNDQAESLYKRAAEQTVRQLARWAMRVGVQGVVCSPKEVGVLAQRSELQTLKLIAVAVRSPGKPTHDQARVDTPAAAIKAGATYIVVGREVTQASNPLGAFEEIEREVAKALAPAELTSQA